MLLHTSLDIYILNVLSVNKRAYMKIERIADWDQTYLLYRAKWRDVAVYGTTPLQAIKNMLGVIEGLNWKNYEKHLI